MSNHRWDEKFWLFFRFLNFLKNLERAEMNTTFFDCNAFVYLIWFNLYNMHCFSHLSFHLISSVWRCDWENQDICGDFFGDLKKCDLFEMTFNLSFAIQVRNHFFSFLFSCLFFAELCTFCWYSIFLSVGIFWFFFLTSLSDPMHWLFGFEMNFRF